MASFAEVLVENTVEQGTIEHGGKTIPYRIIRKELAPDLPGFMGVTDDFLFISEEVPEEFRPYALAHEVICNRERAGQQGRCVTALQEELQMVPLEMRPQYTRFRRNFFEALVRYYQNTEGPEELKAEIAGSLDYLRSLGD